MNTPWSVQDAKARFSELLKECMDQGPQIITKHGKQTAVIVPIDQWLALKENNQPSLKDLLLSKAPPHNLSIPKRGSIKRRTLTQI